jgi:hypothetical protein
MRVPGIKAIFLIASRGRPPRKRAAIASTGRESVRRKSLAAARRQGEPGAGLYLSFISWRPDAHRTLTCDADIRAPPRNGANDGSRLSRGGRGDLRRLRPLRRAPETDLKMIVAGIYIVATIAVTIYMFAALLRPEDF